MIAGVPLDLIIAIGAGVFVVMLFLLALLVPRRALPARSTDIKLDDVKARLDEVERKQNQADHDLRNVRMTVQGLATKDSVSAVAIQVAEMRGEVKGLVTSTATTARAVERIEGFLLSTSAEVIVGQKGAEARS